MQAGRSVDAEATAHKGGRMQAGRRASSQARLLEAERSELRQVDAPVLPDVTLASRIVGVLETGGIKLRTVLVVGIE